jgi:phenylalanyl-tRNA synthetase beta chain
MIVNSKWLSLYTEIPFSAKELESRLTYLGLEAKLLNNSAENIENVVVAEVLAVEAHPNANNLKICRVSTGSEELDVICGAPNVTIGQKVVFARVGAKLKGSFEIKAAKIRGINSMGMICAEDELGIGEDHSGIMVLPNDTPIGSEISEYLNTQGFNIDIDLTPNRPDASSHIGIAREIALLTQKPLHLPSINISESNEAVEKYIRIEIQNPQGCPRYAARVLRNVKVKESPIWLVTYLKNVGLRSINNIVDASNFVLMETGHPLHTFDYANIKGKKIVVRNAHDGELVTTLDDEKRTLNQDILLICDAERPVAIAGIMGLLNSEITAETTEVLLESAYFDPATIRKGSRFLGLQTDASYRFERGADPEGAIFALNRLTDLIVQLSGGTVCRGLVDEYPRVIEKPIVTIRFQRINRLIGMDFTPEWVSDLFVKLGCKIIRMQRGSITVESPSWRPDLEREVDYIEEVVRVFGMENVDNKSHLQIHPTAEVEQRFEIIELLRSTLTEYGLTEIYCNSLVPEHYTRFGIIFGQPVRLRNPLSQDMAYLRNTLIPGMLSAAHYNINRKNTDLSLFELGFAQRSDPKSETGADEQLRFAILLTGNIEKKHWSYSERPSNLFYLKGLIQNLAKSYGFQDLKIYPIEHPDYLHLLAVDYCRERIAVLGQILPAILAKQWDFKQPVYLLEGNGEAFVRFANFTKKYQALPVFPTTERDISIVVREDLKVGEVSQKISERGGTLLQELRFYDLYTGKNIDKGLKSFTFNLVFGASDRTLTDTEVDEIMSCIINTLETKFKAILR